MLILALIPTPIFYINQLNHFAAFLSAKDQTNELMMFYLELHRYGGFIISIFFGLWLFPIGYLVYKSSFIPKFLGIFLMIGCFGYLISFVQGFIFPGMVDGLWKTPALVVIHLAEISLMLWLIVMGVNTIRHDELLRSKA